MFSRFDRTPACDGRTANTTLARRHEGRKDGPSHSVYTSEKIAYITVAMCLVRLKIRRSTELTVRQ